MYHIFTFRIIFSFFLKTPKFECCWTKTVQQCERVADSLLFSFPAAALIQTEIFIWLYLQRFL
jgi:hypothetical protein